jgi:regulator of sigma E protease
MGKISSAPINPNKKVIFMIHSATIILAILSLGFLIFIHELGHFLAAKRCRIPVEKFSIGFGPKLIGFRRGETDYCLSAVPFGGFVKMSGENPDEQKGETGEFASAPVGHRIFVAIAGPAMNVLLGILLFSVVFLVGLDYDTVRFMEMLTGESIGRPDRVAQIGLVADNSPAKAGGIEPGDIIVSINDRKVKNWQDFNTTILTSPDKELRVDVSRAGQLETLHVTPNSLDRKGIGQIKVSSQQKTMVESVVEGSSAAKAGVQSNDLIETINEQEIHHVPEFGSVIWEHSNWFASAQQRFYREINNSQNGEISLGIRRGTESLAASFPITWIVRALVEEGSNAENAGIQTGDEIVAVNGEPIENFELHPKLYELTEGNPGQSIEIGLFRSGERLSATLIPELAGDENRLELQGLHWELSLSGLALTVPPVPIPQYNLITALGKGIYTNWLILEMVGKVLKRLIIREVSPKFLTGPIGIVHATNRIIQFGLMSLIFFVGFISVNLAIVNLLPIPIADGGQILLFSLEKLRGRPLSIRKQIIIQQVSIVLLAGLFLYITFYDLLRIFLV